MQLVEALLHVMSLESTLITVIGHRKVDIYFIAKESDAARGERALAKTRKK